MTEGAGNDEMVRVVAEQLFATWESKHERQAKESRRWWQSNAPGWVTMGVMVIGAVAAAINIGSLASQADARSIRNETAINAMRISNTDRLARIETKVDRILEDRSK